MTALIGAKESATMTLSNRTIALLSQPFEGGDGPSHSVVELIWESAGAFEYLGEGNKLERVLGGLRSLQVGRRAKKDSPALPPDEDKLRQVVADLATRLMARDCVDVNELHRVLTDDGFAVFEGDVSAVKAADQPADRLAQYVEDLFESRSALSVAANHYAQATRAFDREDWEAANAQFRSSFDATFDALATAHGAPGTKSGGSARAWLQGEGVLEEDAAQLIKSFAGFAGRDGSHAGLSAAADAQLRRHFATALIAFALAKFP
jgi:hypothetical protein